MLHKSLSLRSRNALRSVSSHQIIAKQLPRAYITIRYSTLAERLPCQGCKCRCRIRHITLPCHQRRGFCRTPPQANSKTPEHEDEDSENFWKVPAHRTSFWTAYVSTRPAYSPSFYKLIYNYHASHLSSWKVAHDVGCGAGQVTAALAARFEHVIASEINETHLVVAERRLRPDFSDQRISYKLSMGEQLAEHYPSGSADLIATAEAMVLMDDQVALQSFAKLLRPGGTLAFWFYGRPTFADPRLHAEAQPLIDASCWLDYVRLDPNVWIDVHRIKWNTYGTLPFFGQDACGFAVNSVSRVGGGDKIETIEDRNWWRNDWDVEQLKDYFQVLFPGFKDAVGEGNEDIKAIYEDLQRVMGKGTAAFTWPVALVMATRK